VTDLVEVNDIVTDALVKELRPGDRIEAVFNETWIGTVVEISLPEGEIVEVMDKTSVEVPPRVVVQFDNGQRVELEPQFLRVVTWRWQCLELKRL
jgi:hypothetical protein